MSAPPPAAPKPRAATPDPRQSDPLHGRRYPKMLALLEDADQVPLGSEPLPEARPPPVPGTFFPTPRQPVREPAGEGPSVDDMLTAMAEGLLVGGDGQGSSEVVVTLRDEYFRGTELRVGFEEGGQVSARLLPPDRDTYRQLSSELHRLEARLLERGLRVGSLQVEEP